MVEAKGKSRRAYGHVTRSYGIKSCVNSSKPIHICSDKTSVIYKFWRGKKERDWINIAKNRDFNIMIGLKYFCGQKLIFFCLKSTELITLFFKSLPPSFESRRF